jgi:hypothetical protein
MSATSLPISRVHAPGGGWRDELAAIGVVWHREPLRFTRNRLRMVTSLVQPLLFLFILGSGLSNMRRCHGRHAPGDRDPGARRACDVPCSAGLLFTLVGEMVLMAVSLIRAHRVAIERASGAATRSCPDLPTTAIRWRRGSRLRWRSRPRC